MGLQSFFKIMEFFCWRISKLIDFLKKIALFLLKQFDKLTDVVKKNSKFFVFSGLKFFKVYIS